jgi:hypothetical protein
MSRIRGALIKVIRVPVGPAPEEIRKAWVGLVLDVICLNPGSEFDYLKMQFLPERESFLALKTTAFDLLEKKDPSAARWFRENSGSSNFFTFGEDEFEILPAN